LQIINFDHMSHPELDPRVAGVMRPWLEPGTQSSPHGAGPGAAAASRALDVARTHTARLLGGDPGEIVFAASGSEALNLGLKGLAWASRSRRVVVSAVEHVAVRHAATFLARFGYEVVEIPVTREGILDLEALDAALDPRPAVVAVQAASNEIGAVQPLAEVGRRCRAREVPLLVDAVVAAGRIALPADAWDADAVAVAGHQFGGPRGAAALRVRSGTRLVPLVHGGIQEGGRRAGAENVAAVAGLGEAARLLVDDGAARARSLDAIHAPLAGLAERLGLRVTGPERDRLPGHLSVLADGLEGESVVADLGLRGVLASTGSTCTRAGLASRVLAAIGLTPAQARGSLAFTAGPGTTPAEVDALGEALEASLVRLRALLPRS